MEILKLFLNEFVFHDVHFCVFKVLIVLLQLRAFQTAPRRSACVIICFQVRQVAVHLYLGSVYGSAFVSRLSRSRRMLRLLTSQSLAHIDITEARLASTLVKLLLASSIGWRVALFLLRLVVEAGLEGFHLVVAVTHFEVAQVAL